MLKNDFGGIPWPAHSTHGTSALLVKLTITVRVVRLNDAKPKSQSKL
jgi:hypothetical protein